MDAEKILQGLRDSDARVFAAGFDWDQYEELGPPSWTPADSSPIILARLGATILSWIPGTGTIDLRLHATTEDAAACYEDLVTSARDLVNEAERAYAMKQGVPAPVVYYA